MNIPLRVVVMRVTRVNKICFSVRNKISSCIIN